MADFYGSNKRERAAEKARKKRERAARRAQKREEGPAEIPMVSADEIAGNLPSIEEAMDHIEGRGDSGPKGAADIPCRLFVGGLSWDTTTEGLKTAFGKFGEVTDAIVMEDRGTGRSRGFGFVTMASSKDAKKAIDAMDGEDLDGRRIAVNIATSR